MLADFDDGDEGGAPLMGACELPEVVRRREALEEGGDGREEWRCPICPLTDRSARSEAVPPSLAEFRAALASQPLQVPEVEACRALSGMFNRTCAGRGGVGRIAPSDVRRHLAHTLHLQAHEERMLDERIWQALRVSEQIERTSLWYANADREAKLDREGFSDWCKAQDAIKKMVEVRHRFHPDGAAGGVQKRPPRPRYHFARSNR